MDVRKKAARARDMHGWLLGAFMTGLFLYGLLFEMT
jgi:hypothetical protein